MGDVYEVLLERFADNNKVQAGKFYAPRSVVRLLMYVLGPRPGEAVYNPTCGDGRMPIKAIQYMHDDSPCCGSIFR